MTKTNEPLSTTSEPQENFNSTEKNHPFSPKSKNKSRRWKYALPDLIKTCFICDSSIQVKYNLPRKKYSQKNNWGYWTKKAQNQSKFICNACLWKLHQGKMSDWIKCPSRADVFYNYIKKGQFGKKTF